MVLGSYNLHQLWIGLSEKSYFCLMLLPVSILTADPKIHTQKNGIAVKYSILKNSIFLQDTHVKITVTTWAINNG